MNILNFNNDNRRRNTKIKIDGIYVDDVSERDNLTEIISRS